MTSRLGRMLFSATVAAYRQNSTKHVNTRTLGEQAQPFTVTAGGT